MNREYIVYRDSILDAIEHLDEFTTKMEGFVRRNPNYSYTYSLEEEEEELWKITVNVKKNEQVSLKRA